MLAPRGKILDREGRIIVDNYPSFSVLLLRDQNRNLDTDADKIASRAAHSSGRAARTPEAYGCCSGISATLP